MKPCMEAVLKRSRTTKHLWVIACDANMSPEDFEKSLWFRKDQMHVIAPEGVPTSRLKNARGEWVAKGYDYVIACSSLKGRISDMKVKEDFESRPLWSGTSKNCRRRYLVMVEEARKRKEGKKEKKAKEANKGSGTTR